MNRFTESTVSSGRSAAIARAASPTTMLPSGRYATADGSSRAPVTGSASTRGPSASSRATRLYVVPRSMPMMRATSLLQDGVFDVAEQGAQVGDLREPARQLIERGRPVRAPGRVALLEVADEARHAPGQVVVQTPHLGAQPLRVRAGARRAQLLQLLLRLEHLGRQRRRHLGAA